MDGEVVLCKFSVKVDIWEVQGPCEEVGVFGLCLEVVLVVYVV